MPANSILRPTSRTELVAALALDGRKLLVAGGTDIVMRARRLNPGEVTVIDLSRASFLKESSRTSEGLRVGAGLTMSELAGPGPVRESASVLAMAATRVGSTQIRNLATIGGNVASAAQCADTIPALIALGAEAELVCGSGTTRRVAVAELVLGIGKTAIESDEAIVAFLVPKLRLGLAGGFGKIGSRKAVTIAKINGAGLFRFEGGRVKEAHLAFGSLGERAFEAAKVARALEGMAVAELADEAVLLPFVEMVDAAIPGRLSLPYKRSAVRAVAAQILEQARAAEGGL